MINNDSYKPDSENTMTFEEILEMNCLAQEKLDKKINPHLGRNYRNSGKTPVKSLIPRKGYTPKGL